MFKAVLLALALLCCSLLVLSQPPTPIHIWPQPSNVNCNNKDLSIQQILIADWQNFKIEVYLNNPAQKMYLEVLRSRMNEFFETYVKNFIFYDKLVPNNFTSCNKEICMNSLVITVEDFDPTIQSNKIPTLSMDETYSLFLYQNPQSVLKCSEIWGCIRGLETFAQMVDLAHFPQYNALMYSLTIKELFGDLPNAKTCGFPITIQDSPRYPWRGLMIDTSRHFVSKQRIFKLIQIMATMKMNVLHIHLVDAQSFPLEVEAYPLLAQKGSYSHLHYQKDPAKGAVNLVNELKSYSPETLKDIVAFGAQFGIRVVPEVDLPGHAAAFGPGYPESIVNCGASLSQNINNIPLDISSPKTFEIVKAVFMQLRNNFPDEFVHIGGDEVVSQCYLNDPRIVNFLKSKGWPIDKTGVKNLIGMFENQLQSYLMGSLNKTSVVWEEVVLSYDFQIPKQTIIQVWREKSGLAKALQKGFSAILSAGYYLDKQNPSSKAHYAYMDTWRDFYENDPETAANEAANAMNGWKNQPKVELTNAEKERILGGEACEWAETVDGSNFEERIFPRTLAVAERLWSPSSVTDQTMAMKRITKNRCYTIEKRGGRSGPVQPMNYCPFSD